MRVTPLTRSEGSLCLSWDNTAFFFNYIFFGSLCLPLMNKQVIGDEFV